MKIWIGFSPSSLRKAVAESPSRKWQSKVETTSVKRVAGLRWHSSTIRWPNCGTSSSSAFTGAVDDGHRHRFDPALAVADESRLAPEELGYSVLPLIEELLCVDDDEGGLPAAGDKVQGHDRLAAAGACLQYPEGAFGDQVDGRLLIGTQGSGKGQFNLRQHTSQINDLGGCSRMLAAQQAIGHPERSRARRLVLELQTQFAPLQRVYRAWGSH